MFSFMRRFQKNEQGAVGIMFGLSFVPLIAMGGAAVDYSTAIKKRANLQQSVDTAVLAGAKVALTDMTKGIDVAKKALQANLSGAAGEFTPTVTYNSSTKKMTMTVAGSVPTNFLGFANVNAISIQAEASALINEVTVVTTKNPNASFLDSEAGDYNRIYAYCFDDTRKNMTDKGRTQMTPLMDNAGTTYKTTIPECKETETVSFRLYNVRNSRTNPSVWETATERTLLKNGYNDYSGVRYDYYTDTVNNNDVMTHQFPNNLPILETKVCDTLAQCKGVSKGGLVPEGKNRTPVIDSRACSADKFMYFGWEDRPPGYGWTDGDFDDITFVIECPKKTVSKLYSVVRLVQ
jgi:Flp pilus assembly protein TadG